MNPKPIPFVDRRKKPRMNDAIPVSVRGTESGKLYTFETTALDIGAGGLCAFSPRAMKIGEKLSLRIRFARAGSKTVQAPEIRVRGLVTRVEERPGCSSVFAVSFLPRSLSGTREVCESVAI